MRILCVIPAITIETLDKKININGRCHWYLWWNDADAGKCGVAWRFSVGDMAFLWLAPTQHCQNSVFILRMFLQCFEGDVFFKLPAHSQIIFAENVLVLHFIDKHSTSCTPYVCELNIKLWKPLKTNYFHFITEPLYVRSGWAFTLFSSVTEVWISPHTGGQKSSSGLGPLASSSL